MKLSYLAKSHFLVVVDFVALLFLVAQSRLDCVVHDVLLVGLQLLRVEGVVAPRVRCAVGASHVIFVDRLEDPEAVAEDVDHFSSRSFEKGAGALVHLLGVGHQLHVFALEAGDKPWANEANRLVVGHQRAVRTLSSILIREIVQVALESLAHNSTPEYLDFLQLRLE